MDHAGREVEKDGQKEREREGDCIKGILGDKTDYEY